MNEQEVIDLAELRGYELDRYLFTLGYTKAFFVSAEVGDIKEFPKKRNVAYTEYIASNECKIVIAPKFDQLTEKNFDAVIRHEYGHVLHFMFPDIFKRLKKMGLNFNPRQYEIFADRIAEIIYGDQIYYDRSLIQTLKPTSIPERPKDLGW